jgi:hypothetical protein
MIKVNRIKYVCVSLTNTRLLDDTHFVIEKISESYPEMKYILGGKGFEIYPEIKKNMIFLTGDVHKWNEWFEKNIRAGDRI